MDSRSSEIAHDFSPLMKVFKDGRIERIGCDVVPPSFDPTTNVESKDIVISKNEDISARIYVPKPNNNNIPNPNQKLPLLVYFHGGAFIIETPFSPFYHKFLNSLVSKANIIAVSVHYRKAPEHPLPIAYEDSWTSLKWVASHLTGNGPDEWLNCHADFGKVFFGGDSAGANIAHHMTLRVGSEGLGGINKIEGIILVHSYFWGLERVGSEGEKPEEHLAFIDKLWPFTCPTTTGLDDPLLNPAKDPNWGGWVVIESWFVLPSMTCSRTGAGITRRCLIKVVGMVLWSSLKQREKDTCFISLTQIVTTLLPSLLKFPPLLTILVVIKHALMINK